MGGLATFGLAPMVPLPNLGTASAGTAVAAATAEKMYFMGWYTARLNKTCSPDVLMRELNLNPDVANEIFSKLLKTKTVSPPNVLGVSRTLDPLTDSYARMTTHLAKETVKDHPRSGLQDKVFEADKHESEGAEADNEATESTFVSELDEADAFEQATVDEGKDLPRLDHA